MTVTESEKEAIYSDYYGKVYGYCRSRLPSSQDAEDVAADVFVKVYEKLGSYDENKSSLSTWIYTITRNTLTDRYRTGRLLYEIPEEQEDGTSVEDDVCRAEMLERLAGALSHLPERERNILILRYYSGKTLKDIAERLDISYSYAKVLQNKALDEIKKYL